MNLHQSSGSLVHVVGQAYAAKMFKPSLWTQNDGKKWKLEQEG
jgi:hypothetical protein